LALIDCLVSRYLLLTQSRFDTATLSTSLPSLGSDRKSSLFQDRREASNGLSN
jgi:hypothetical protein